MNRRDIALMDDGEVAALGEDLTTSAARTFVVASDGGGRR